LGYNDPVIGYRWLVQRFATVQVEERKDIELDLSRENTNSSYTQFFVPEEELDTYRYYHPYMRQRGLIDAVIEVFDIGYDKSTDSITFPVRYWSGENFGRCMFVAKRNIKYKRFDLPKNMEKPLYGLYEVWKNIKLGADTTEIYICEGLFDCLRMWCNGKIAVAGFGCLFSEYQITLLQGLPTRKLILALDNDEAGREATARLKKRIKNKIVTEVVLPKGRKDIGECTDEEIENLQEIW
jgi:DNA primase